VTLAALKQHRCWSAVDAGVPLGEVQVAARDADPRTNLDTRRRENFDRHAGYDAVAFVAGGVRRLGPFPITG
jgi:hypothetical protein